MLPKPLNFTQVGGLMVVFSLDRFLCSNTYPDVVCRSNYSFTAYNPPLLYDLHSDPSEIYDLDTTEYADIMAEIRKVQRLKLHLAKKYSKWYNLTGERSVDGGFWNLYFNSKT